MNDKININDREIGVQTDPVLKTILYSKTPVVILTLDEYKELTHRAKKNERLTKISEALSKLKNTLGDADNLCNEVILAI